jgi:tRNA 5-methylaminomethyl-2-thiouridine biosynthesis bifunctional protein
MHLPRDEKIAQRFERVRLRDDLPPGTTQFLNAAEASKLLNMGISQDCLYYPSGGWLSPASLCRYNLDHPHIQLLTGFEVQHIECTENQWRAINPNREVIASASMAVIANGHHAGQYEQSCELPLKQVAGQISRIQTRSPHALQKIVCHKGYVLPIAADELLIGATYVRDRSGYAPDSKEHAENLGTLKQYLPGLGDELNTTNVIEGRVGYRCVVPGRMPVAGLLTSDNCQNLLAISTAHASRGILSSGLCAEIIADQLCNTDSGYGKHNPVVSPARFRKHDH